MLRSHHWPYAVLVFPDKKTAEVYERALALAKRLVESEQDKFTEQGSDPEAPFAVQLNEARAALYELSLQIGVIRNRT